MKRLLVVLGIFLAFWLGGFLWFINLMPTEAPELTEADNTDAIIVVTGGIARVDEGITLLREGYGKVLFVSGVGDGVTAKDLLTNHNIDEPNHSLNLALGYFAKDTRGNASEVREWVKEQGYKSLRLVTSNYHLPRSMLEFEAAMPELAIIGHPVFSGRVPLNRWWVHMGTTALLLSEYHKYMAAKMRIMLEGVV